VLLPLTPDVVPADRTEPLLFAELPGLRRETPWRPLAHVPTPVEPCDAIEPWLGRGGVFVKRDDLVSPLYGGNKVRRYEYLLERARRAGARRLVTAGGLCSTQVTATALFGAAVGFGVTAVLFDQPWTSFGKRALLVDAAAGAELIRGGGYVATAWKTWRALRAGPGSVFLAPGASSPLANLGYVDAMLELSEQVQRGEMPRPDAIVVPSGSAGTLVGIALGAAYLGWPTTVWGVRITELVACNRLVVGWLARRTARALERRAPRFARWRAHGTRIRLFHGAFGGAYGRPTPGAIEAIPIVERLTGVPGEVTYTGKALVALRAIGRMPDLAGKTILYWHTLAGRLPDPPAQARDRLPPSLARLLDAEVVA
jgi:D-cysteine desulfhydrase